MQKEYTTSRLSLSELNTGDDAFIQELVNTDGWIRFIGDRNVKTKEAAASYIQKIIDNPNILYWVVRAIATNQSIGVITFIKRDYLDHHDIGFAFLPQYQKNGYAYEAAQVVLNDAVNHQGYRTVLATLLKDNHPSLQLLARLGFQFQNEIFDNGEALLVYAFSKVQ